MFLSGYGTIVSGLRGNTGEPIAPRRLVSRGAAALPEARLKVADDSTDLLLLTHDMGGDSSTTTRP